MKNLPRLWCVSDDQGDPERICRGVFAGFRAGLRAFQIRERSLSDRSYFRLLCRLREGLPRGRAALIVNDRLDLARAAGADGVHLGFRSVSPQAARDFLGPGKWIGISAHHEKELADPRVGENVFFFYGPVWPTPSKRKWLRAMGLEGFTKSTRSCDFPVIAIGGVDPQRVAQLVAAGGYGAAFMRAFWNNPDPEESTRALLKAVKSLDPPY